MIEELIYSEINGEKCRFQGGEESDERELELINNKCNNVEQVLLAKYFNLRNKFTKEYKESDYALL